MIVLAAGTALGRLAFGAGLLFFFAIAIAAMAVLTIHKILRKLAETRIAPEYQAQKFASLRSYSCRNGNGRPAEIHPRYPTVICIQSDCYSWRGKRYFPKISGSEGTASYQEQEMGQPCL
jgi:hypothetical protein